MPIKSTYLCTLKLPYVDNGSDCNDNDEEVNPTFDEICDGVDNNCDDEIDNNAVDSLFVYFDGDGDGFGTNISTIQSL